MARLSDVVLLYRLQQLEDWLGSVLAALLGEVVCTPGTLVRPVQIVDATSLGWPGPRKGVAWRIHARLELAPTRFSGFVVTDGSGAERRDRFTPVPGAIVLADRCYARHGGMAAVWGAGADLVVRYGLSSRALQAADGARLTLNGVLGRAALPGRLDLPVRLILLRRPPDSAAKVGQRRCPTARIERKPRKRGGTATVKQRRAAPRTGWCC